MRRREGITIVVSDCLGKPQKESNLNFRFYRKAERGHVKSSLCLLLTASKVEMKESGVERLDGVLKVVITKIKVTD